MAIPHDQLLKEALAAFLADFVTLFAPEQASDPDFSTVTLLNQEVFTELAAGSRREMDLLAEVKTRRGALRLVLIHGEVQRQSQRISDPAVLDALLIRAVRMEGLDELFP